MSASTINTCIYFSVWSIESARGFVDKIYDSRVDRQLIIIDKMLCSVAVFTSETILSSTCHINGPFYTTPHGKMCLRDCRTPDSLNCELITDHMARSVTSIWPLYTSTRTMVRDLVSCFCSLDVAISSVCIFVIKIRGEPEEECRVQKRVIKDVDNVHTD